MKGKKTVSWALNLAYNILQYMSGSLISAISAGIAILCWRCHFKWFLPLHSNMVFIFVIFSKLFQWKYLVSEGNQLWIHLILAITLDQFDFLIYNFIWWIAFLICPPWDMTREHYFNTCLSSYLWLISSPCNDRLDYFYLPICPHIINLNVIIFTSFFYCCS